MAPPSAVPESAARGVGDRAEGASADGSSVGVGGADPIAVPVTEPLSTNSGVPQVQPLVPTEPSRVGRYEIARVLGRGGMGVVYEACSPPSKERVALKVAQQREHALARLRAEIAALQQVLHPGIVRLLDTGSADGVTYYAMELLQGETWSEYQARIWRGVRFSDHEQAVAANGRLHQTLRLALGLTHALAHLHGLGWVHCDLSPRNVLIRSDGTPCLMDLGLASRHHGAIGREALESVERPMGTPGYMAPEQALGLPVDARADLYALGAMLYWTLTGRLPLRDFVRPSSYVLGIPPELDELLRRLLLADRTQRVTTALECARMLTAIARVDVSSPAVTVGQLFRSRLFGRDDVMRTLTTVVRQLGDRGHCVSIGGVSGVGKTTVAMAAARAALADGARVVTGACVPLDPSGGPERLGRRAAPFAPLQALLFAIVDYCQLSPELVSSELREALRSFVRYDGRIIDLLGAREPLPSLTGEAIKSRLCFDLATLLSWLARSKPVVLLLDDLQWADELTLGFLFSLLPKYFAENRVLLLSTYRAEESDPVIQSLVRRPSCRDLFLPPLEREHVTAMVGDMLGRDAPDVWAATLHQRSGGNPFAVAEYLREALEEGRLSAPDAYVTGNAAAGSPAFLPESLEALIQRRFARLSPAARFLIDLGAVIGHPISRQLLQATAQLPAAELASQLDVLVSLNLFEMVETDRYRFLHDKLRECAYASLDARLRRALHLRVGSAIEAAHGFGAPVATEVQMLAHHFARGGEVKKAIDYLQAAAEVAHQSFANREVRVLLGEALALAAEAGLETRWRWHFLLGSACFGLGLLRESQEHLSRMLRLLGLRTPARGKRGAWRVLMEVLCQLRHRTLGAERSHPEDRNRLLAAATAHDVLMQVGFFDDDAVGTLFSALASLNLAERAGPSAELSLACANVQSTVAMLGLSRLSKRYQSLGLAAAPADSDPDRLSSSCVRRSSQHIVTAEWEEAERCCAQVVQYASRIRYERREEEGIVLLAYVRYAQGRFLESRKLYEQIHSSASRGDTQVLCWSFTGLAFLDLMQAAHAEAIDNARAGLALAGRLPGRAEAMNLHAALAVGLLRLGDRVSAERHALAALDLGRDTTLVNFLSVVPRGYLPEVFQLLAHPAHAPELERAARESVRQLQRVARFIRIARPRAHVWRALSHWQRNHWRRGLAELEKGLRQARALVMPYDGAYIELLMSLGSAAPGAEHGIARQARELLSELGADFDARAAQAAWDQARGHSAGGELGGDEAGPWNAHAFSLAVAFQGTRTTQAQRMHRAAI